jgi:hypothetical protein
MASAGGVGPGQSRCGSSRRSRHRKSAGRSRA